MTRPGLQETIWLIVCEPTPRWLPAVKTVIAQRGDGAPRLRVRSMSSPPAIASLQDLVSPTLLLVEVGEEELSEQLPWIRSAARRPPIAVAALLRRDSAHAEDAQRAATIADALREAGAAWVFGHTEELAGLPRLAERHAASARSSDSETTFRESVWRRLPWQPDPWPLG